MDHASDVQETCGVWVRKDVLMALPIVSLVTIRMGNAQHVSLDLDSIPPLENVFNASVEPLGALEQHPANHAQQGVEEMVA